jgi:hypothetical protein
LLIYRALLTDGNSELANKSNFPLFRLPGELRNKIYEYIAANFKAKIVVDESNWGRYQRAHRIIVCSNGFRNTLEVSHQLRKELWSYLLHHSSFKISWQHLEGFVQYSKTPDHYFEPRYRCSHIKNLVIDVSDRLTEGIELNAVFFAECLRPLCRNGRLQNIKLQTCRVFPSNEPDWYMRPDEILEALRSKLDFGSVGKDVFIEACYKSTRGAQR